ncbi:MAG: 50S ribosomal protein L20 [Candidatus Bipolaricaulota bacterium]
MPRVKRGNSRLNRRKKILDRAKGYYGKRGNCYRIAKQSVMKALKNAYIDRRRKKREFRRLWITRIGAAAKQRGLSYSKFMGGLNELGVDLNRKMLAEMAVRDPDSFDELVSMARAELE